MRAVHDRFQFEAEAWLLTQCQVGHACLVRANGCGVASERQRLSRATRGSSCLSQLVARGNLERQLLSRPPPEATPVEATSRGNSCLSQLLSGATAVVVRALVRACLTERLRESQLLSIILEHLESMPSRSRGSAQVRSRASACPMRALDDCTRSSALSEHSITYLEPSECMPCASPASMPYASPARVLT